MLDRIIIAIFLGAAGLLAFAVGLDFFEEYQKPENVVERLASRGGVEALLSIIKDDTKSDRVRRLAISQISEMNGDKGSHEETETRLVALRDSGAVTETTRKFALEALNKINQDKIDQGVNAIAEKVVALIEGNGSNVRSVDHAEREASGKPENMPVQTVLVFDRPVSDGRLTFNKSNSNAHGARTPFKGLSSLEIKGRAQEVDRAGVIIQYEKIVGRYEGPGCNTEARQYFADYLLVRLDAGTVMKLGATAGKKPSDHISWDSNSGTCYDTGQGRRPNTFGFFDVQSFGGPPPQ